MGNPILQITSYFQSAAFKWLISNQIQSLYKWVFFSVTSPTPPAGIPPVPLVTIHTHIVTWLSTPWTHPQCGSSLPSGDWSCCHALFINNHVTNHHCDISHLHRLWSHNTLFIYLHHTWFDPHVTVDKPSTIVWQEPWQVFNLVG